MGKKFFIIRWRPQYFCDDMLDFKPYIPGKYPKKKITFNGKEIEMEDRPLGTGFDFVHSNYDHLVREVWEEEMSKAIEEEDEERIKFLEEIKSKVGL